MAGREVSRRRAAGQGARKRPKPDEAGIRAEAIAGMIGLGLSEAAAAAEALRTEERVRARVEYARSLIDRLKAAHKALDAAWFRWLDENPGAGDEDSEIEDPDLPEQAAVDAVFAEIEAITRHDRWPAHLHAADV